MMAGTFRTIAAAEAAKTSAVGVVVREIVTVLLKVGKVCRRHEQKNKVQPVALRYT